jgi:HAD superfamily hydrolase (TIGR01509 family)
VKNLAAVVFDIGNVLLRWDPRNLYRKVFSETARMEWFLENICDGPWNLAQDLGRTWKDAISERIARYPEWEAEIRAYDERWLEMLNGVITENVQLLQKLKGAGIGTYAISNFSSEKWQIAKSRYDFFRFFDGIVISGQVRLIKPDPRIFQLFLDSYDLAPGECIFIDDSKANVSAARQLGMSAVHYREPMDLSGLLREQGIEF